MEKMVIDSKVSLTDYAERYVNADEEFRGNCLKDHINSCESMLTTIS
jgi:DNA anti-recombination protein RmuC